MICVSIAESNYEEVLKDLSESEFDLAELRLDLMRLSLKEIGDIFSKHNNLIATCHPGVFSEEERKEIISRAIKSGASWVDLDLENSDEFKAELIELAQENKCQVIISYHNYDKTPDRQELLQIVDWCFDSGADAAKIACQVNSIRDSARLLSLYDIKRPLIAVGMGPQGYFTRIAGVFLGAPFTYASIKPGKETAPGQITWVNLKEIIERIKSVET